MRQLLALGVLAACHAPAAHGSLPAAIQPGGPIPAGGVPLHSVKVDAPPPAPALPAATVSGRRRGVPHFAQITGVVVDRAGTRALSRDTLSEVRIWPALDGSLEPQVVPARDPQAMAIAARKDGSLAALIDSSGILSILTFDREGLLRSTATMPPDIGFAGVALLDGGERAVAVRSDQRLVLLDDAGKELAHLAMRASRVLSLEADGDRLIAVLEVPVAGKDPVFRIRALTVSDDKLAWDGVEHDLPAPVAKVPQLEAAVSPDGTLFGYMTPNLSGDEVRLVRIATGKEIALDSPATSSTGVAISLGFTDDHDLDMAAFGGNSWRIEIDGDHATAISDAQDAMTALPAFANGMRIGAYQASLILHRDTDGDVEYLGHADLVPSAAAISPDGASIAWTTSSGAIVVQRFDGTDDVRIKSANDYYSSVVVIDDGHVIAGRNDGRIALFDSKTGTEVASMVASTSTPYFFYEPKTKLLAVMRDTGTVWVIAVDPAAKKPFAAPIAVGDGANSFALLDPDLADGAVLLTADGSMQVRHYSLATLSDGVTAKEMKAATQPATASSWGFDRAGDSYQVTGPTVQLMKDGKLVLEVATPNGASGVYISPQGDQLAILEPSASGTSLRVVDRAGKTLWQMSARASVYWVTWSEDEAHAVVLAQGGAQIVDAATGDAIGTGYGWSFGLSNVPPNSFPPNIDPEMD